MSRPGGADELICHLDVPLPSAVAVGGGSVLYLTGRCYHRTQEIRTLEIVVDDARYAVVNHSRVRPDVPSGDPAIGDTVPNCLTSGFWAAVPLAAEGVGRAAQLSWRATLADGTVRTAALGSVRLERGPQRVRRVAPPDEASRRVAICIATRDPDPDGFAALIASIVAQRHDDWVAVVCDDASTPARLEMLAAVTGRDPRFRLVRNAEHLGRYGSVARALEYVPADADFVALAEQDDVWRPDTLVRLLAACGSGTMLAFAAADVGGDGDTLARPSGTSRRSTVPDLASLVLCDALAGAGGMFRAELLADLLPFPPRIGDARHEQWIACAALALGEVGYAGGTFHARRPPAGSGRGPEERSGSPGTGARRLRTAGIRPSVMAALWRWREVYGTDVVRAIVLARTLLVRLGARAAPGRRAVLERLASLEARPFGLVREAVAALVEGRPGPGAEWRCLQGTLADRALDHYHRWNRVRLFEERSVRRALTGGGDVSPTAGIDLVESKITPLRLAVRADAPRRVNLLVPAIDFAHLFAGYLGKLHLALRLADGGYAVRLVIVDACDHDPPAWRRAIAAYPGLEALFDRVEVAYAADRGAAVPVHPRDAFVATTWWTAHLAHAAVQALGGTRFVYLIQECEPMTFPMGSLAALAAESYGFPHVALFSTSLLRDYFRDRRLGVFAAGDAPAFTFENAIERFPVTPETLRRSGPRRLAFYARPEQHAARNMFEIGVLALRRAVADGLLPRPGWIVEGIGAGRAFLPVPLGEGQALALLPRMSLAAYRAALPTYDVGLALMLTPHPSLVPLEMAAAGMLAVTNTYANKTETALRAIAGNLVPVPPTIAGVHAGLVEAIRGVDDVQRRVAGSRVAWSTSWRDSFDDRLLARLAEWLGDPSTARP